MGRAVMGDWDSEMLAFGEADIKSENVSEEWK